MADIQEVRVPDIGDFDSVDVVEVLVAVGDTVDVEQSLITLESDKASMEVPSSAAGVIKELKVAVGDQIGQDAVIALIETAGAAAAPAQETEPQEAPAATAEEAPAPAPAEAPAKTGSPSLKEVKVPDIGDFDAVDVVEVLVAVGDTVEVEQSLITLESDKASMEVPSPVAGTIKELRVSNGDQVGQDATIAIVEVAGGGAAAGSSTKESPTTSEQAESSAPAPAAKTESSTSPKAAAAPAAPQTAASGKVDEDAFAKAYASPSVRRLARELGVDLGKVEGTGRKGRITEEDVKGFVKTALSRPAAAAASSSGVGGFDWPQIPEIDFSRFGPVETEPLTRIQKVSSKNLHRSWLHVPHVTQNEEADITEMEAFRKSMAEEGKKRGVKLTPVAFQLKAVAAALQEFPRFNASLAPDGENLIVKKYYHIAVAVDTPNGLVVPVIRDVDQKGLFELAAELGETSGRMRDGKMTPQDFQGSCFTISSLGGIGGTSFTPIVNAPEVAILGVSRAKWQPVYQDGDFVPRLMLPLSLSYDHRVIDGALACRFIVYLAQLMGDIRRLLL